MTRLINDDGEHLTLDPGEFLANFPRRHFPVQHRLAKHPLFELERLVELASALPVSSVEFNAGNVAISQNPRTTRYTGMSVQETIRNISSSGSWVVLKYAEADPQYRQLLNECVRQIAKLSEQECPGTRQLEAYIFISSPHSITPFHFDDEHNFLLQVRGSKAVHTWRVDGPGAPTELELERYYCHNAHRNLPLRVQAPEADAVYTLNPGDGLHVPVHSTHWVKNGDEVSVSFSATFRSRPLAREVLVHRVNDRLRRIGISPRPYGQAQWLDQGKYLGARAVAALANRARQLRRARAA